jgi:hypothetical protein
MFVDLIFLAISTMFSEFALETFQKSVPPSFDDALNNTMVCNAMHPVLVFSIIRRELLEGKLHINVNFA